MTIDIYDNVLESDLSTLIDTEMKKVRWKYDYNSHKGEVNKHWHIHCGDANIKPQYSFIQHIWDVGKERYNFEEKYKVNKFKRVYTIQDLIGNQNGWVEQLFGIKIILK